MEDKKKRRRKRRIIKRICLGVLFIAAIFTGWGIATLEAQVNSVLNQADRTSDVDLSDMSKDREDLVSDDDIINILLVGADKRESWKEKGRSDSTMIATLDLKHKRLKLTSLMRDMYVPIPGHEETRFNAAYSYGGVSLLYETVASNFGIKMDGYVVVDFAAFKQVINKIGGVKIELTDAEYQYLTTAYKKGSVLKLKPGLNNMNGAQALAYTRIRQDAKGDFGRTERQRKVLQAIFKEAKSMSYSKLLDLAKEVMGSVATDLTNKEIFSYMKTVVMMGTTTIDQHRIPIDNSYTQKRIRKMAVLIPDMEVNSKSLHDFIFEYDGEDKNSQEQ